ncbi:hypothetical protein I5K96_07950 [Serratia marcescens]|jgi:hypothetical protein|nr:hypothetical protein [Serratia marcescens]MBN5203500.1 hypothetical protein [Serratia marcescens]
MSLFVVVASSDAEKAEAKLKEKFEPQNLHEADNNTWFVSAPESIVTPKELFDHLEFADGAAGRVLIFMLTSYYGYHFEDTWNWLTAKRS